MRSRTFAILALMAALSCSPLIALAGIDTPPTPYAAGAGIAISSNAISVIPVSSFSNVTCTTCAMSALSLTSPVTLDSSPVATDASVATAISGISFPVTSVNGSTGAITGLETTAHASATYSTPASVSTALAPYLTSATAASTYATLAQATYTGTGCVAVSGSNVISSSCGAAPLTGTTGNIGGGLLAAGACASGTVTITGATVGMVAVANPTANPGSGVQWQAYVSSANTVTVQACVLLLLTPTATTYNVRVIQ